MKNLDEKHASQKLLAKIFLAIGLVGIALCLLPWLLGISIQDGAPAIVIFGSMFAIIGLLSSRSLFNRARILRRMSSGFEILARWTYDSPPDQNLKDEFGEIVIGSAGLYAEGELYTFSAYSCRLESVTLVEAPRPQVLFVISIPRKHGRHQKEISIPVPEASRSSAATAVQVLNNSRRMAREA